MVNYIIKKQYKKIANAYEYAGKKLVFPVDLNELNEVCEINSKNIEVPVEYQNLFFCLNNIELYREETRRKLTPKAIFYSVYLENNKENSKLIQNSVNKVGHDKFAFLTNRNRTRISDWKNGKRKIPITAVMKSCQILNIDFWTFLNNKKLFSQNRSDFLVFCPKKDIEIAKLLVWIKNEGTISINRSRLEIEQNLEGYDCLKELKQIITKNFGIDSNRVRLYIRKNKNRVVLRVNSAALRSILCLYYNIPIGFKSYLISSQSEINMCKTKKEKLQLITSLLETEGGINQKLVNKKLYPRINFTSASLENVISVYNLMKELNCDPTHPYNKGDKIYRVSCSKKNNIIKLLEEIEPFVKHKGKLKSIKDIIKMRD